jgi:hypothetical protein
MLSAILPFGALHQRDHAIEEGRALRCGDPHLDPIRQHARAAGDGRAVAAGFANDWGGLPSDGRLVHRGDAFDDLTVAWDQVAGFHEDDVALLQLRCGHDLEVRRVDGSEPLGRRLGACLAQRCRLRLAAAFRHRLGEVGEQHGDPQPDDDLEGEPQLTAAGQKFADEDNRGERRDDLDDEHHRVPDHHARIKLDEGLSDRRHEDRRVQHRGLRAAHLGASDFHGISCLYRRGCRRASRNAPRPARGKRLGRRSDRR